MLIIGAKYRLQTYYAISIITVILLFVTKLSIANDQPNIILIIADDVSWNDFGCYGNEEVKTINIDRLAHEGIRFTNAFLTASSCSPSRCSIISGKYPHSNGAAELHTPLPASEVPFPLILKENGYYTAQAGKWHLGPNVRNAFDRYTEEKEQRNGNGGEGNWVRFLRERPRNKPFFFWFASYDAHRQWGADTFHITHDPAKVKVPIYLADTPETRQDIASYYNEIARLDFYIGNVRKELEQQNILDNTMIIVMADNGRPFPRCKTRVYDSGMKTPFVVYHQKTINKPGIQTSSLISSIDIAPSILELAGIEVPPGYQGISFLPILENPDADIRNLVFSEHNWHDYEAHERMARTNDYLYILNSRPNLSNCGSADSKRSASQAALDKRRDEGSLTFAQTDIYITPRPREELYDVRNDSLQILNLASTPKYNKVLIAMREMLEEWQKKTNDSTPTHLTPDWFDRITGITLEIKKKEPRGTMPGGNN